MAPSSQGLEPPRFPSRFNNTKRGTEYTIGAAGGGPRPQPTTTGSPGPQPTASPSPSPTPKPKNCKKIKNKKKRKECKKKNKQQPPKERCPEYVPGEQGTGQPINLVTDEHTAEAPLELVVPTDPGGPNVPSTPVDLRSNAYVNVQVDTAAADTGLYATFEFEPYEDYDLYLNYADGTEAARSAGFNQAPVLIFDGTGDGGHSGIGSENLDGVRTPDCGGYTINLSGYIAEGGDKTLKLWLGEPTYDPPAPGGGTIAALGRLGIVFDD
jgi:hypothetical protein